MSDYDDDGDEEDRENEEGPGKIDIKALIKSVLPIVISFVLAVVTGLLVVYVMLQIRGAEPLRATVTDSFRSKFQNFESVRPARPFPEALALYDLNNKVTTIDDTNGKYRLINFWATWCTPCVKEIPTLINLSDRTKDDGLEVLFVSMDFPDSGETLGLKIKSLGIPPINSLYIKDYEAWNDLKIKGLPATFILDKSGNIHYVLSGDVNWVTPDARLFIESIIK